MSENLIYADLNLTETTRPRLQKVTDAQDPTYAEVKVQSIDANAATSDAPSGKSCCSRTRAAVFVAVITLLLVIVVCLILMYHSTASSPPHSKTFSTTSKETLVTLGPVSAPETSRDLQPPCQNYKQKSTNSAGCPPSWEKNGKKCYCLFGNQAFKAWNAFRQQCADMGSDLVIIENKEELNYLNLRTCGGYYLLGLNYSESEEKWKWINNVDHSTDMFTVEERHSDYFCAVIGHGKVSPAPCNGDSTTKNMCEKAADISARQNES
ncbi:killer cell lectin-like receptor subfamily B member 1B allele B isoform X1 [Phalacrocorax aristotelis]|uniref:killer cell lectin-like receptor subfamily B member 1B allele B isoform X1 n=1 Tax=Phalacrocorax aristotelis TaxID=126867 RepID=UPI003F4C8138